MKVSSVDQDRAAARGTTGQVSVLVCGDTIVFMIFSWLGRNSHHEAADMAAWPNVVGTAAPFLVAWLAVASVRGLYSPAAAARPRAVLTRTAVTWGIAGPIGLVLRALVLRRGIPPSFAIVALLTNLALLLVWRLLAARLLSTGSRQR